MKICFYNTFEPVSPLYRDLIPLLLMNGYDVEVVISFSDYRTSRPKLDQEILDPRLRIIYLPSLIKEIRNNFQKLWVMTTYILGAIAHSLISNKQKINVFLTQPPLFSLWGWILKITRKEPYVLILMDIYPDVSILAGVIPKASWATRILFSLSRFIMREANSVVVIGRDMAHLVKNAGVKDDRIKIIPNWANEEQIYPIPNEDNELRKELGLVNDFVILYSGNMGVSHYFNDLLEVAKKCKQTNHLKFIFIGSGTRREEIEGFVKEHSLNNVILLPFQSLERLPESLSLGDVHFVSLRNGFEGLMVPSKVYGSLAVGKPIIYQGAPSSEIAQLILNNDIGEVISQGDVDKLECVITSYLRDREKGEFHGENAQALSRNEFSYRNAIRAYLELFQQLE